jgi:hypothetical protein
MFIHTLLSSQITNKRQERTLGLQTHAKLVLTSATLKIWGANTSYHHFREKEWRSMKEYIMKRTAICYKSCRRGRRGPKTNGNREVDADICLS